MANNSTRTQIRPRGKSVVGLLTVSGVFYQGHRFHNEETVALLDRLLNQTTKPLRRGMHASAGTVPVLCTVDHQGDRSFIHVYDAVLRQHVRLPAVACDQFEGPAINLD
jgi:hypothetical protein